MKTNQIRLPTDGDGFAGSELEATYNNVARLDDRHKESPRYFRLIILSDGGFDATLIRRIFEERFQSPAISVEVGVHIYELPKTLQFIESDCPDAVVLAIADPYLKMGAKELLADDWGGMVVDVEALGVQPTDRNSAMTLNQLVRTMDENLDRAWAELLGEVKISRDALVKASSALSQSETVQQRVEALSRDLSRIDESISDLRNADTQILLRDGSENPISAILQNKVVIVLGTLASFAVYMLGVAGFYWLGIINTSQAREALLHPMYLFGLISEEGGDDAQQ